MQTLSMKAPTALAAAAWRAIRRLASDNSSALEEQRTRRSLERLDDYLLTDIGIDRSQIVGIGKHAWRKANRI